MHLEFKNTSDLLNLLYDYSESGTNSFNNLRIYVDQKNKKKIELSMNFADKESQEAIYPALFKWIYNEGDLLQCDYYEIQFVGCSDGTIFYDIENVKSEIYLDEDCISLNVYKLNDGINYNITFHSLVEASPQYTESGVRLKINKSNRVYPKVKRIDLI